MDTAAGREDLDTGSIAEKNFDVTAQIEGDKLCISLISRIDSLISPKKLFFYENTAKENQSGVC